MLIINAVKTVQFSVRVGWEGNAQIFLKKFKTKKLKIKNSMGCYSCKSE